MCSSELYSMSAEAHCNAEGGEKKESKRRMDEKRRKMGESERMSEQVSERELDGWMGKREREREQRERDALVRHAMLGWNQVRPT